MELQELKKLAELSKLQYTDEELMEMSASFDGLVALVDVVKDADIKGERKLTMIDVADLREDIATDGTPIEVLLSNAPDSHKNCVVVPRIME